MSNDKKTIKRVDRPRKPRSKKKKVVGGQGQRPAQPAKKEGSQGGRKKSVHIPKKVAPKKKKARHHHAKRQTAKKAPKFNPDLVRVIPLGGVEEVGRNLIVIEVGADIFVSDVGFEFTAEESAPGVDYIIPNTSYLEERKDRIKGVFITHGHLDHIGGIPYVMEKIGNPPIYTRPLTGALVEKRQEDFPHKPKLRIIIAPLNEPITVGSCKVTMFPVTHSIPESTGLKFATSQGNVVISGDLKLDHVDGVPSQAEEGIWGEIAKEDNLFFISDSTNAERPGFSITEDAVARNISDIIRRTKGRIVLGTFASQLARIIDVLKVCQETGRKVVLEGRSISSNLEIAEKVGLYSIPPGLIIESSEMREYDHEKILIIATGAQGEEYAALRRMAGGSHRHIKLSRKDTVLLASSVIPGNERSVQLLRDMLFHHEVSIITYRTSDVHSTGHGNIGELLWIFDKVNPKYFMPGYGFRSMTFSHAEAVADTGFPRKHIVLGENGTMVDFLDGQLRVNKEKAPVGLTVVDGDFTGEMSESILEERKLMAEGGIYMFFLKLASNSRKPKMLMPAEIRTRGTPLPANPAKMMVGLQRIINNVVDHAGATVKGARKYDKMKLTLAKRLSEYLLKQTKKRPFVELVIFEN